ncbi:hypothetical protein U9M48_040963 [Paspalum notatum var. saurae]|uniref:Uncharacterized protein n=1 Tax=Paspalum notatum var. saurae TaxID=547442 RepID=A0AAQ3URL0_PASNO
MAWAPDSCSLRLSCTGFTGCPAFDPMIVELEAARLPSSPILSGCSFEESEDPSLALAASPFPPSAVMSVTGDPMVVELEATLGNALVMPSSPPLFECPFADRDGPTFGPPVSPLPPSTGAFVAGCPDAGVGSPQRPSSSEPRPAGESVALVASFPSRAMEEFVALVRAPLAPALVPGPPQLRVARSDTPGRRSARLAAKSEFRAANAELQARKILLTKLGEDTSHILTAGAALAACQAKFGGQLFADKRAAIRELFPRTIWEEEALPASPVDVV